MYTRHSRAQHETVVGCKQRSDLIEVATFSNQIRKDPQTGRQLIKSFKQCLNNQLFDDFNDGMNHGQRMPIAPKPKATANKTTDARFGQKL